jgi:hypothetical protein
MIDLPNFKNAIDWYYGIKTARLRVKVIGLLILIIIVFSIWYLNEKRKGDQQAGQGGNVSIGPGTYKAGDGSVGGKGGDVIFKAGDAGR